MSGPSRRRRDFFDLSFWQATVSGVLSLTIFAVGVALVGGIAGYVPWSAVARGLTSSTAVIATIGVAGLPFTIAADRRRERRRGKPD